MALEEHPEAFFERFERAAFEAEVLPAPYGHPLLELAVGGGILPVFDRGAPPLEAGRHRVLVHGVVREHRPSADAAAIHPLAGGATRLVGFVREDLGNGFLLVESTIPVVLWSPAPLSLGERYVFDLAPPLMGFRP